MTDQVGHNVDAVRVANVLAKLAVQVLEAERERTGVDEWDEADVRCYLYDAAYAWLENDPTRIPEFSDDPWEDEDPRHYAHRMGDPDV